MFELLASILLQFITVGVSPQPSVTPVYQTTIGTGNPGTTPSDSTAYTGTGGWGHD